MTVLERLQGCPNGATRDALRACGHTDQEIDFAKESGRIRRIVWAYTRAPWSVEWFYANEERKPR